MRSKKRDWSKLLKDCKIKGEEKAAQILPILSKDPDWPLVTGKIELITNEDHSRKRLAVSRLTKRAVRLMYPQYAVSVRCGRGTSHHWVYVNLTVPELNLLKVKVTQKLKEQENEINCTVEKALIKLGIRYGTYYTDYGKNDSYHPMLSVTAY